MEKNPLKVVVDTNVIISAIVFGGKPKKIIQLIIEGKIIPIISKPLIAELVEILCKKFKFSVKKMHLVEKIVEGNFKLIYPSVSLDVVYDKDDNRVLEAALEGRCIYIITGDRDLLELNSYKGIKIMNPESFLNYYLNL